MRSNFNKSNLRSNFATNLGEGAVNPAHLPQITIHPLDDTATEFTPAQMVGDAVSGDGSALTWQWFVNFREHPESLDVWQPVQDTILSDKLTGWDTSSLDFLDATRVEDANYRFEVTNDTGTVVSDEAKLDVIQDPAFAFTIFPAESGQSFGWRPDQDLGQAFGFPEYTLLSAFWFNTASDVILLTTKGEEKNGDDVEIDLYGFTQNPVTLTWNDTQNRYDYYYTGSNAFDDELRDWVEDKRTSSFPFMFINGEFGEVAPPQTHILTNDVNTDTSFYGHNRSGGVSDLDPDTYQFLGVNNSNQIVVRVDTTMWGNIPSGAYCLMRWLEADAPIQNRALVPRHDNRDFRAGGFDTTRAWLGTEGGQVHSVYCELFDAEGNLWGPSDAPLTHGYVSGSTGTTWFGYASSAGEWDNIPEPFGSLSPNMNGEVGIIKYLYGRGGDQARIGLQNTTGIPVVIVDFDGYGSHIFEFDEARGDYSNYTGEASLDIREINAAGLPIELRVSLPPASFYQIGIAEFPNGQIGFNGGNGSLVPRDLEGSDILTFATDSGTPSTYIDMQTSAGPQSPVLRLNTPVGSCGMYIVGGRYAMREEENPNFQDIIDWWEAQKDGDPVIISLQPTTENLWKPEDLITTGSAAFDPVTGDISIVSLGALSGVRVALQEPSGVTCRVRGTASEDLVLEFVDGSGSGNEWGGNMPVPAGTFDVIIEAGAFPTIGFKRANGATNVDATVHDISVTIPISTHDTTIGTLATGSVGFNLAQGIGSLTPSFIANADRSISGTVASLTTNDVPASASQIILAFEGGVNPFATVLAISPAGVFTFVWVNGAYRIRSAENPNFRDAIDWMGSVADDGEMYQVTLIGEL